MILDRITLAGLDAYLRAPDGATNLASPATEGRTRDVAEGEELEVAALSLSMEWRGMVGALARRDAPLLTLEVRKEMFPGLFAVPFARRVHRVAGFDDLAAGEHDGIRVLEVDGVPALVTSGVRDTHRWKSARYELPPQTPGPGLRLASAAWELPVSTKAPDDAFSYDLDLRTWPVGSSPGDVPRRVRLASGVTARAPRFADDLGAAASDVGAFKLELRARVHHDAFLRERVDGAMPKDALGRPVLTAVHLLEVVPSARAYHSLAELLDAASDHQIVDSQAAEPSHLRVRLPLESVLTKGESIALRVHPGTSGLVRLEARIEAERLQRPPRARQER